MQADFWLERWREGRIGFHQDHVTPMLAQHWGSLEIPAGSQVLVPLCGKSKDMAWLARLGYRVLGVELSPMAVEQFFDEHQWKAERLDTKLGRHYSANGVEIIQGDIFALDSATLRECRAVFDRAALIALPPEMRKAYVRHVYAGMAAPCSGLLITLDYPQEKMAGPPFSVSDAEVRTLFGEHTSVSEIERVNLLDSEPQFAERGLDRIETAAYRLEKKPG